jgi:hypothetical protein
MPCKLKPIPSTTDFNGPQNQDVTLVTNNHIGDVLISKAEYGGRQLVAQGTAVSKLTFKVLPDRNTVKLVFVFSASTAGRGELREVDGGDSQFLRDLRGTEPFQMMRIVGV